MVAAHLNSHNKTSFPSTSSCTVRCGVRREQWTVHTTTRRRSFSSVISLGLTHSPGRRQHLRAEESRAQHTKCDGKQFMKNWSTKTNSFCTTHSVCVCSKANSSWVHKTTSVVLQIYLPNGKEEAERERKKNCIIRLRTYLCININITFSSLFCVLFFISFSFFFFGNAVWVFLYPSLSLQISFPPSACAACAGEFLCDSWCAP